MHPKKSEAKLNELAPLIHQAALNPHCDLTTLNRICDTAIHFGFSGLCTNLNFLSSARQKLGCSNKETKLIAVIAFPFGTIPPSMKKAEAEFAANNGADELEVVPSYYLLKEGKGSLFAEEIAMICSIGIPVRVIFDTATFSRQELELAIEASLDAGTLGIQIGNGFGRSVDKSNIAEIKQIANNRCPIKAAGGIKSLDHASELIQAGASSLGTSYGADLMEAFRRNKP